jgi:molybdate transport system substrate-binding protein
MSTEITGVSSMATRHILDELAKRYEEASGVPVAIRSMGGVDAAKLVRSGDVMDIVVLASGVMAQLESEGHLAQGSVRPFTRSGMAIAVREGAPQPDIGGEDAVRRAVLAARKVGYSTGPSGDHLLKLCERWGVAPEDRLVKAPPGVPVASLVAEGEADLGVQQLSELLGAPGIAVVGPMPPQIQAITVFAAGVASTSAQPQHARDLIAWLASPETADAKRRRGMEPGEA